VAQVRNQTERINAWGESRFRAWSEYYQTVHDFIRSVVRVDQDRAVRYRLRDAIKAYGAPAWFLCGVQQEPYRHLREPQAATEAARVERLYRAHETLVEDVRFEASWLERLTAALEARLQRDGEASLVPILQGLLPEHPRDELFMLAGELVEWLAHRGHPEPLRELHWQAVGDGIEVQNLTVYRRPPPGGPQQAPRSPDTQAELLSE
jgi:chromosome partition protein MukF